MEYTIEATAANEVTITIGASDYSVYIEPNKIVPLVHTEEEADVTVSPTITPITNVYELSGVDGDKYTITFNEDGVYKIYVEENSVFYVHIFICINDLDEWLYDSINSLLCLSGCTSTNVCNCNANCQTYYSFNVVAMICMTFFGEDNMGVAFNYNELDAGYLYEGYKYKCTDIGSGNFDWKSGSDVLLIDPSGNNLATGQLVLDRVYTCIKTGIPDEWGSTTNAHLCAITDVFSTKLNYISDSIDRFERYIAEPSICDCV